MKWFKHLVGSIQDKFISDLIHEFGGDGYLVFFGILDLMADDFDIKNPGKSTFTFHFLKKNLQLSRHKISKILLFFNNYPNKKGHIFSTIGGDNVLLSSPRLKELCDEWTTKQLRINSGAKQDEVRRKEGDGEEDKDKEDTPHTPPRAKKTAPVSEADFHKFYDPYPKHKAPQAARKALEKALKITTLAVIVAAVEKQIVAGMLDGGQYTKHPATWLNQGCWEDEIMGNGKNDNSMDAVDEICKNLGCTRKEFMEGGKE